MKRIDFICQRCDKPWSSFKGSLCPSCGGNPIAKDTVKGVGGAPLPRRGTKYLSDEF